ncbi:MAG: NADPH-dependent F420 reductase [Acidobacteria bacterium]|nr:NADPH-dependent F420 reductase [Acidobacteriota bacterium]
MGEDQNTVAVVGGTGDQGFGLALRWAKAGRHVLIGSRVRSRAEDAAARVKSAVGVSAQVEGMENVEAVAHAPLVILSVPYEAQIATLKTLREVWRPGQILVDLTVPLETSVGGSPSRLLGVWAGSAAEQAAQHVPDSVAVVGAFHNVSAHSLQEIEHSVECDVIVCSDNADARGKLRPWVEAIPGCQYVDGGKLENARIVESLTALLIGMNRRYKVPGAGIRVTGLQP